MGIHPAAILSDVHVNQPLDRTVTRPTGDQLRQPARLDRTDRLRRDQDVIDSSRHHHLSFAELGDAYDHRAAARSRGATLGLAVPGRRIPPALAHALATAGETAWRTLPLRGRPPMTRFAYWICSQECTLRIEKARDELGYQPVRAIADGLHGLGDAVV